MDSGIQLLGPRSFSGKLGLWISIVSRIPDSHRCFPDSKAQDYRLYLLVGFWIPTDVVQIPRPIILDSLSKKFQDSGFHMQKFPGFRNPDSLTLGDTMDIIYFLWAHDRPDIDPFQTYVCEYTNRLGLS